MGRNCHSSFLNFVLDFSCLIYYTSYMKLTRTIKLKLNTPSELIRPTIEAYTKAFNHVCQVGWQDKDYNGVSLHHKTYRMTREYLPAQLAVSARMKATEALKAVNVKVKKNQKTDCPQSRLCSIRLDDRSYNVWFDRQEVSILTVNGRQRIPLAIPDYFTRYLGWRRRSADLFLRRNKVFLHIVMEKELSDPVPIDHFVGIDRGINKIAVTSDNRFFNGGEIKRVSRRYQTLRSELQSCGSRSAKRHLRRMSKKENRFRADINHRVSKRIIEGIPQGATIVLEDLKSIRQRVRLHKKQRAQVHRWNFFQLQEFLTYKAQAKEISIECVDSRYTSQKCSRCGHTSRSNRRSQSIFKCRQCGFSLNADLNASRNIRQNYLDAIGHPGRVDVSQPIVAHDDVKAPSGGTATECSYKPLPSGRGS